MPRFSELIPRIAFFASVFVIVYAIGAATVHYRVFPYPQVLNAMRNLKSRGWGR